MNQAKESHPQLIYTHTVTDYGHGRIDHRFISVLDVHDHTFKIAGIEQVAEIVRTRTNVRSQKKTQDTVLVITNIPFSEINAADLLALHRSYWDIENKLHYRKDFVFAEDRSTIRTKHGPANMATLRNFALGVLLCNGIGNVKRCVENLRNSPQQLLQVAA
jgi:hypothetical protein